MRSTAATGAYRCPLTHRSGRRSGSARRRPPPDCARTDPTGGRAGPAPAGGRVLHQLTDPLVALLLAAAVVTTVLRDYPDTAVIVLVVLVNTIIGVVQEVRADRAIAALDQLAAPTARVVRDGRDVGRARRRPRPR